MIKLALVAIGLGLVACAATASEPGDARKPPPAPIASWPLAGDLQDRSGNGHHAIIRGTVDLQAIGRSGQPDGAAGFNGRDAYLELPATLKFHAGHPFSIAAWVYTDDAMRDLPGDIVSKYDASRRRGFHLTLKSNAGVTTTQANFRHLQFGIDNDRAMPWTDTDRPGNALLAFALVAHEGHLYAGTCEPGEGASGRVYRYSADGEDHWIDCGSPTAANSVTAMASFGGKLYAGTGKYRLRGSALQESTNENLGGRVLAYEGDNKWADCGQLPGIEAIGGLVVFDGRLYASSLYRPAGFFRYEGGTQWTELPNPGKRVEAVGVYNGYLWGTSYDGGHVYRYDGTSWTDCGQLGSADENTQTYSFAVYQGRLCVGTWRTGRVYRFEDVNRWTDIGRLGEELEVMGMLVHNGRLIAGTLPLAEVYEYQGQADWRRLARLDSTPDVMYRRAWTMAEFGGRVFCSTLPSGNIWVSRFGATASWDHALPAGWHHIAAVREASKLLLYVDGKRVSESEPFNAADYMDATDVPLRIGYGENDFFCGRMSDVRLYDRAVSPAEIVELAGG